MRFEGMESFALFPPDFDGVEDNSVHRRRRRKWRKSSIFAAIMLTSLFFTFLLAGGMQYGNIDLLTGGTISFVLVFISFITGGLAQYFYEKEKRPSDGNPKRRTRKITYLHNTQPTQEVKRWRNV